MEDMRTTINSINEKLDYLISIFEMKQSEIDKEAAMALQWQEIEKKIQPQPHNLRI